jgi:hypothetical protein
VGSGDPGEGGLIMKNVKCKMKNDGKEKGLLSI